MKPIFQTYFWVNSFYLINLYMNKIEYPFKTEFIRSTTLSSFGLIPVKPYI